MFSFDEMCKKYSNIENNLPKTMDALHYEIDDSGKLTLYIIEFKAINIAGKDSTYTTVEALYNNLKKKNNQTIDYYSDTKIISDNILKKFEFIREHFVDSIEVDLIFKPMETLFVALPWLYDEYCKNESVEKKDFRRFIDTIDIKLIVFVNRYAPIVNLSAITFSAHMIDNKLKSYYNRLYLLGIIVADNDRIFPAHKFSYFLKKEKLVEK